MERVLEKLDGEAVIIEPEKYAARDIYRLMTGLVVPRPIAFVSTLSAEGIRNLAPFSFFTAISANPPVICFSPMNRGRDATLKDTLRNIEATHEFVVNIVCEELAIPMNAASADYPPDVDEFRESGLTPVASDCVKPPRVAESPASMECTLLQVVHVSDKPLGGSIVLGRVVRFHVNDELLDQGIIDPNKFHSIGRMGGSVYTRTTDRFDLERPVLPAR